LEWPHGRIEADVGAGERRVVKDASLVVGELANAVTDHVYAMRNADAGDPRRRRPLLRAALSSMPLSKGAPYRGCGRALRRLEPRRARVFRRKRPTRALARLTLALTKRATPLEDLM
jgi:hypothetical protein